VGGRCSATGLQVLRFEGHVVGVCHLYSCCLLFISSFCYYFTCSAVTCHAAHWFGFLLLGCSAEFVRCVHLLRPPVALSKRPQCTQGRAGSGVCVWVRVRVCVCCGQWQLSVDRSVCLLLQVAGHQVAVLLATTDGAEGVAGDYNGSYVVSLAGQAVERLGSSCSHRVY
jgi:hypothetical protein